MRWAVPILALAACGRVGFDALSSVNDGGGDVGDTGSSPPATVVQTQSTMSAMGTLVTVPIAATQADTLVIVVTSNLDTIEAFTSIADNAGNTYASANSFYMVNGHVSGEIWYATSVIPGATAITITNPSSIRRSVWVLELSGANKFDTAAEAGGTEPGTVISPKVTPSRLPAVIVTQLNASGAVTGLLTPEFHPLGLLNGDQTAYAVVTTPGTYGAEWTIDQSGNYGSATAAFGP